MTTTTTTGKSLFERLGGEAAVEAAVVDFYERVMADPTLSPFFEHLDMDAQIKKQIAFMKMAFGGPNQYTARTSARRTRSSSPRRASPTVTSIPSRIT